jgi:hypothetical protein
MLRASKSAAFWVTTIVACPRAQVLVLVIRAGHCYLFHGLRSTVAADRPARLWAAKIAA